MPSARRPEYSQLDVWYARLWHPGSCIPDAKAEGHRHSGAHGCTVDQALYFYVASWSLGVVGIFLHGDVPALHRARRVEQQGHSIKAGTLQESGGLIHTLCVTCYGT